MNTAPEKSDWFQARYSQDTILSLRITARLHSSRSPFQKIEVFDTDDFGRILVLDGVLNVAELDEFIYHEMMTHVPLFTHEKPERILVVGGGDGGILREAVKHDCVRDAVLVEIDKEVTDVSRRFFPKVSSALSDSRVTVIHDDASKYIQSQRNAFDGIIIDSTDPIGAGERLFTPQFYRNCFAALTENGVLSAQSESPFFDPDIVKDLYATAAQVFPIVRMYTAFMPSYVSGLWSFLYASKNTDPVAGFQAERYAHMNIEYQYYNADIHRASFSLPSFVKKQFSM